MQFIPSYTFVNNRSAHELTIADYLAEAALWWCSRSDKRFERTSEVRVSIDILAVCVKAVWDSEGLPQPIRGDQFTKPGQLFVQWAVWYQLRVRSGANAPTTRGEQMVSGGLFWCGHSQMSEIIWQSNIRDFSFLLSTPRLNDCY